MWIRTSVSVGALLFANSASSDVLEKDVQVCLCGGVETEFITESRMRADCRSRTQITEVDRTSKIQQALGQSLIYSVDTGLKPRVVLFCDGVSRERCLEHVEILQRTVEHKVKGPFEIEFIDQDHPVAMCVAIRSSVRTLLQAMSDELPGGMTRGLASGSVTSDLFELPTARAEPTGTID